MNAKPRLVMAYQTERPSRRLKWVGFMFWHEEWARVGAPLVFPDLPAGVFPTIDAACRTAEDMAKAGKVTRTS